MPKQIEEIQILRFIAAFIVVLDHCSFVGSLMAARHNVPFHLPMFPGRLGVDIFFIISGFIMVYISSSGERWTITPVDFFRNRWVRIVPIYLVATALYVALYFLSGNFGRWSPLQYLTTILFIPYFDDVSKLPFPILSQGWTLCFEMFFYAIFAISLSFSRRAAPLFLGIVFVSLVAVGAIWNLASGSVFVLTPMHLKVDFIVPRFWMHPIILEFLAGIFLAILRERLLERGELWPFRFRISTCIVIVAAYVVLSNLTDSLNPVPSLIRFCCALSVVAICVFTVDESKKTSLHPIFVFLGGCSYSLYLFHTHVIFVMDSVWKRLGLFSAIGAFVLVGALVSVLLSVVAYQLLEVRIIRFFRSMRPKISVATPAPTPTTVVSVPE